MRMTTKLKLAATAVAAMSLPSTAQAASFFAGTGHYYEFVNQNLTWQQALAAAATAAPMAGYTAHLVTITSAAEDAFVKALAGSAVYVWAAGTDEGEEGTWKWAAGPEAGQTFYIQGAGIQPGYSNWNGGEPNNLGNEDYLHINANTPNNWNDIYNDYPSGGYVVEYSLNAVPEPATWAMMIVGFGAVGASMRRRKNVRVSFA